MRRPTRKLWSVSESGPFVWVRLVQRREPLHPQATLRQWEHVARAQRHQQQVHPPTDHQGETYASASTCVHTVYTLAHIRTNQSSSYCKNLLPERPYIHTLIIVRSWEHSHTHHLTDGVAVDHLNIMAEAVSHYQLFSLTPFVKKDMFYTFL